MTLVLDGAIAQRIPLQSDAHSVIRVGGTRIPLDTVVAAYRQGQTSEGIVERYDSLTLPDVYTVIAFYLTHQAEIDAYLSERERAAGELRAQIEAEPRSRRFRTRLQLLKARRQAQSPVAQ